MTFGRYMAIATLVAMALYVAVTLMIIVFAEVTK